MWGKISFFDKNSSRSNLVKISSMSIPYEIWPEQISEKIRIHQFCSLVKNFQNLGKYFQFSPNVTFYPLWSCMRPRCIYLPNYRLLSAIFLVNFPKKRGKLPFLGVFKWGQHGIDFFQICNLYETWLDISAKNLSPQFSYFLKKVKKY